MRGMCVFVFTVAVSVLANSILCYRPNVFATTKVPFGVLHQFFLRSLKQQHLLNVA